MTQQNRTVTINILDKEYFISCADEEQPQLLAAADFVDQKMRALKQKGNIIGAERVAVIAALNIASELLIYKGEKNDYTVKVDKVVERIHRKINEALN